MGITRQHIEQAKEIARSYGADRVILFGRAQTDPEAARDLDLAIGGVPGWTIWELAAELEEALDLPLDIVPLEPSTPFTRRIEERGEDVLER
jgi:predicted nucleotidyltransferase